MENPCAGTDRTGAGGGVHFWRPEYAEAERPIGTADRCCPGGDTGAERGGIKYAGQG